VARRQRGWQAWREEANVEGEEGHATVGEGGEAECTGLSIRSAEQKGGRAVIVMLGGSRRCPTVQHMMWPCGCGD
jgi:hypothetical protein